MGMNFAISFTDRKVTVRCDGAPLPLNGNNELTVRYRSVQEGMDVALRAALAKLNIGQDFHQLEEQMAAGVVCWQISGETREVDVALLFLHAKTGLPWERAVSLKSPDVGTGRSVYETLGAEAALSELRRIERQVEDFREILRSGGETTREFCSRVDEVRRALHLRPDGEFEPPRVVVVGSTGVGKSTLINAIVGRNVLAVDESVATGTIVDLRFAERREEERAEIWMFDEVVLKKFETDLERQKKKTVRVLRVLNIRGLVVPEFRDQVQEILDSGRVVRFLAAIANSVAGAGDPLASLLEEYGIPKPPLETPEAVKPLVEELIRSWRPTILALEQIQRAQQDMSAKLTPARVCDLSREQWSNAESPIAAYMNQADENGYCAAISRVVVYLHSDVLRCIHLTDAPGLHDPTGAGFGELRCQATLRELSGHDEGKIMPCDAFLFLSPIDKRSEEVFEGWDMCAKQALLAHPEAPAIGVLAVTKADKEQANWDKHFAARRQEYNTLVSQTFPNELQWTMVPGRSYNSPVLDAIDGAGWVVLGAVGRPARRRLESFADHEVHLQICRDFVLDASGLPNLVGWLSEAAQSARGAWARSGELSLVEQVQKVTLVLELARDDLDRLLAARLNLPRLRMIRAEMEARTVAMNARIEAWEEEVTRVRGLSPKMFRIQGAAARATESAVQAMLAALDRQLLEAAKNQLSGPVAWEAKKSLSGPSMDTAKGAVRDAALETWANHQQCGVSPEMKGILSGTAIDMHGLEPAHEEFNVTDHEKFFELFSTTVERMKKKVAPRVTEFLQQYEANVQKQLQKAVKLTEAKMAEELKSRRSALERAAIQVRDVTAAMAKVESDAPDDPDAYRDRREAVTQLLHSLESVLEALASKPEANA